ncbi:chemotaxis response regulator protein-glutamate methylesterase [Exilibacterium tricleocarpae]|uniref:Protein-glutamate methylesterase/protein-glutamine glutaminase n=1 Tax=Exilibacterium tricleocarpae TaxID=2591008 RepID=A0A545U467_9GAMM|nr:chemotaxis response regulator protein-glutamate methylesterase [Exilibacterium tricleocarpae]TQV84193.1 chemotaxis response regulator protein-glutamate methylesterase [Exilibacterium tricleocarpae]
MPIRVLVVDDSNFFQHRLQGMIGEHPDLQVVGIAANGREAIAKAEQLNPDIITMDYEMPVLDGVSAVREIMARRPVPILMFSSLTYEGARTTLNALEAGAVDFMPKDFAEVSRGSTALKKKLHERLIAIARRQGRPGAARGPAREATASARETAAVAVARESKSLKNRISLVVIGASTGGPVALTEVLTQLPADFPAALALVQHMPANFTRAFAERLNKQCAIEVREACDGDRLAPGTALLAPGGRQLLFKRRDRGAVRVHPGDDRLNYKPSVDISFASAADVYGDRVLAVVLTGMGADGCEGARLLKAKGATVWSQDEASSLIYGMPMAVARARLSDLVLGLKDVGPRLTREL